MYFRTPFPSSTKKPQSIPSSNPPSRSNHNAQLLYRRSISRYCARKGGSRDCAASVLWKRLVWVLGVRERDIASSLSMVVGSGVGWRSPLRVADLWVCVQQRRKNVKDATKSIRTFQIDGASRINGGFGPEP